MRLAVWEDIQISFPLEIVDDGRSNHHDDEVLSIVSIGKNGCAGRRYLPIASWTRSQSPFP